jgi:hypothetical protein
VYIRMLLARWRLIQGEDEIRLKVRFASRLPLIVMFLFLVLVSHMRCLESALTTNFGIVNCF